MRTRISLLTLTLAQLSLSAPAAAQQLTLPALEWRTLDTRYFEVHYPAGASAWTADLAAHLDAVHDEVSALVGAAPRGRVSVIVQGDAPVSNGFALPFLDAPLMFLWPDPPGPTGGIGESRGWGELLAVHEYAHIAHLTRPSRNPWRRFVGRLTPLRIGPLPLDAPRWVVEGYATYVEGRVTGLGRPHSAWRAAVLRQWALEGQLPTYGALDGDPRFLGSSMAYLAGSAYLQWLVDRSGDSSLVHLWRRMSARKVRTFDEAFAGVFGGSPAALYGRFAAELTGRALGVERQVRAAAGTAADSGRGRLVASLPWSTGSPAVSPDGSRLAFTRAPRGSMPHLVVLSTAIDTAAQRALRSARDRAQRRDPEDVPDIAWRPPPHRVLATLYPHGGVPYVEPRFLPDSRRLLVLRATGRGDGSTGADAFIWDPRTGRVQRITRGAGLRHADPSPDGRYAAADRCDYGICDLVRVDLTSGRVTLLAAGAPRVVYYRPRWSPDGRLIAVSVHRGGVWRTELVDPDAPRRAPRVVGPEDGANRYDAEFAGDGRAIVLVSDSSGVPDLDRVDLASGATSHLTSVTGAALAPAVDRVHGEVYFLRLRAGGLDLAAVADTASLSSVAADSLAYEPAARVPPAAGEPLGVQPPRPSRPYGAGPRRVIVLPSLSAAAEGSAAGLLLSSVDPVGRLTWMAQAMYGERGTWRGGSAAAVWRGSRPALGAETFFASDRPSRQRGGLLPGAPPDADYLGAAVTAELEDDRLTNASLLRLGASAGRITAPAMASQRRLLAYAHYALTLAQTPREWTISERLDLHGAGGRTGPSGWLRGVARLGARMSVSGFVVRGQVQYGVVSAGAAPFERFAAGGSVPPLFDPELLAQRVAMPALPAGVTGGRRLASYRVGLPNWSLEPYLWAAGDSTWRWRRVVGLEWTGGTSGFAPAGLPGVAIVGGAGYSLDPPFRHRARVYFSVRYRP